MASLPDALPLAPEDRAILALESATIAGHTCKVVRLAPGAPSLDALRARIAARIGGAPLLTRRLGGPADAPAWVADGSFDIARHVVSAAPAAPLDRDGVLDTVAALFAQRLPRERPLWQIEMVPLADGGALLVWRIHHALADGTTTMRYARTLLWDGGAEDAPDDAPAPSHRRDAAAPGHARDAMPAPGHSRDALPAPSAADAFARHAADEARRRGHLAAYLRREFARSRDRSPFDGAIGTRREIGFAAVPFGPLHDAARSLAGATVNDAVLSVVAGALRRWLEHHHGALDEVRVKVPVSLHHEGDDAANRDSFFSLGLPLGVADPVARLRAVHAQTRVRKEDRDAERREQLLQELGRVSPQLRTFTTRLERSPRRFALTVSNVVGPRTAVELLEARVHALHSLAEIGERHALRVAVTSFEDRLCFGLLADPVLVPDVRTMAAAIELEAELLVAAAGG
ncbi:MAG TPA: wax ester/triacylglycerol synthase domain-containing protein [Conexibacter sp.]|nr:wax ester/triacylglycerol synthase domain-containing protein [Conexibacter sp.]